MRSAPLRLTRTVAVGGISITARNIMLPVVCVYSLAAPLCRRLQRQLGLSCYSLSCSNKILVAGHAHSGSSLCLASGAETSRIYVGRICCADRLHRGHNGVVLGNERDTTAATACKRCRPHCAH